MHTRQSYLDKLLKGYEVYYNVVKREDKPLVATAFFHLTQSNFVFIEKAELWSANSNEYIFLFDIPKLDKDSFERYTKQALEGGLKEINPGPKHMCSYVDAIFVCDEITDDAIKAVKKYRYRKNFKYSLHGWMEVHTAAVVMRDDLVYANYPSIDTVKYLKSILYGRKEDASLIKRIKMFLRIIKD